MSLERFMNGRLVAQAPETRIYDAVRAMEDNRIGCVLVHDRGALTGIVTDRDIALNVIGQDLDAFAFTLADVMSSPVHSVPPTATVLDIADIMITNGVRRVPIVDGATIRGLVSLDDMLLEHAVDETVLAAVIRSQLSQPARLVPAGRLSTHRHSPTAHAGDEETTLAERKYLRLLRRVSWAAVLPAQEQAEAALKIVLSNVIRRITPAEAADFLAQLPSQLRRYAIDNIQGGPDRSVSLASIERELAEQLALTPSRAADILRATASVLRSSVSPGEISDLVSQLPADMKELFAA